MPGVKQIQLFVQVWRIYLHMSEMAARIRAARAYADLSQDELAERLGLEKQSIVRTEAGRRDPKKGERIAIAAVCGVPEDFIEHGWGVSESDLQHRVERIEATLQTERDLAAMRQTMLDFIEAVAPNGHAPSTGERSPRGAAGRGSRDAG